MSDCARKHLQYLFLDVKSEAQHKNFQGNGLVFLFLAKS